jgi:hypothetical protein
MSNEATRMYSTCFSIASAGYCERILVLVLCGVSATDCCDDPGESYIESTSSRSCCSRSVGGCGERAFRSLRIETDEGLRDEGKDEKEGWRVRLAPDCTFCEAEGGGFDEDAGGGGLWAITCMAAKAIVSILSASPAPLASSCDLRDRH